MLRIRRADERARTRLAWLDSRHTFSFGFHHDPAWMGHGALRVVNQDVVAPGGGFDWHSHRDMEIVSYVLSGALRHQDSIGNDHTIRPGEVQRMTAGTGVTHREWNAAQTATEFLQMWVVPDARGLPPSYDQKPVYLDTQRDLVHVAGPRGPVVLHADADLWAARIPPGSSLHHFVAENGWLHVARGEVELHVGPGEVDLHPDEQRRPDGQSLTHLAAGDGVGFDGPHALRIDAASNAEVLLWTMPARKAT